MKYCKYILPIFLLSQCHSEKSDNQDRELVTTYLGFKKHIHEKYYKIKNRKNTLGEDIRDGVSITFYENGKINGISNYNKGLPDGLETIYDTIGNKITEKFWEANFSNDTFETVKIINYAYYENGILSAIYVCNKNGEIISETSYDKNGKIIP